jgi:hypothetical protein
VSRRHEADGVLSAGYHDIRRFSKVTHCGAAGFRNADAMKKELGLRSRG